MAKPENRLVEQAKAGSADAFGQLYAQYAQDLYRFAYYYLGSREEAEDAVQDAVCAAFQGIGALRSVSSFKAWLFPSFPTPASTTLRRSKRGGLPPRSKKRAAWVKANALRSLCSPWSCGRPSMRSVMKSAASFCSLSSAVTKAMKLPKPSPARPVPFVQNSLVPLRSFA